LGSSCAWLRVSNASASVALPVMRSSAGIVAQPHQHSAPLQSAARDFVDGQRRPLRQVPSGGDKACVGGRSIGAEDLFMNRSRHRSKGKRTVAQLS
jgi:hypothetical protein